MATLDTFYTCLNTGGFVVAACYELAGVPYREVLVDTKTDQHRPPEFLAINPLGQVPALVLADGTVVTETVAMIFSLLDRYPAETAQLAPPSGSAERQMFYRWLCFAGVNLYMADLRYYYPERHTTAIDGAAAVKAAARAHLDEQFAIIAQAMGDRPFILGDKPCAVDLYLAMLLEWDPDHRRRHPAMQAYLERGRALLPALWDRYHTA